MTTYVPTFAEETFIVNCYGTDEDIDRFNVLMEGIADRGHQVELIILVEAIKNRNSLGMDWNCCWRCQRFTYCEINWYRGERALTKTCCPNCVNYSECNKIFVSQRMGRCMVEEMAPPVVVVARNDDASEAQGSSSPPADPLAA